MSDIVALLGVALGVVPIFLHGWVHVMVMFAHPPETGGILNRVGAEVDKQLTFYQARELPARTVVHGRM